MCVFGMRMVARARTRIEDKDLAFLSIFCSVVLL